VLGCADQTLSSMVRAVARSSWPRFVLGLSLAVVTAVTACDDDESNVVPSKTGGSAGAAGEGGGHIGAGASDASGGTQGSSGSAGSSLTDSRLPRGGTTDVFDFVPPSAPPGMSIVVAHEVSKSPSFTLVGTVTEVSADRMSSPNYGIALGVSQ
jgi:hypothetical protein